jgi:hypothetical protein
MPGSLIRAGLACVALVLCACSATPQNRIVGKWEADAAVKLTAEFRGDGTAAITMFGQTLQGTYKLNDGELEWTLNGRTTRTKALVTATELELTDQDHQTIKYKRK